MTGSKVTRQVPYLSGVVHYMPIKLDVMEGLLQLLERQDPKKQGAAWKAIVGWIDPKVYNSLRSVVEWLGSILLRLPVASYCS